MLSLLLKVNTKKELLKSYDVTILQTPQFGQKKGYLQVYRLPILAHNHNEVINYVFRTFNIGDLIPKDYCARFIGTGDVILIDEGLKGKSYYQLMLGGWSKIHRVHIR